MGGWFDQWLRCMLISMYVLDCGFQCFLKGISLSYQCSGLNSKSGRTITDPRPNPASERNSWRIEIFGILQLFETNPIILSSHSLPPSFPFPFSLSLLPLSLSLSTPLPLPLYLSLSLPPPPPPPSLTRSLTLSLRTFQVIFHEPLEVLSNTMDLCTALVRWC